MNHFKKVLSLIVVSSFITLKLCSQITVNTTIYNADVNTYSWPITISGGTVGSPVVVTLGDNISVSTYTNYHFIIGSDYVTINGNGHTITLNNITNYPGLIQNGTSGSNGYGNININNIGILATGNTTLSGFSGWIGQDYFGKGQASATNTASKCYSSGAAIKAGGGIFGAYSNQATANDCYTVTNGASAVGSNGGGIFGYQSTNCAATRCNSSGGGSLASSAGGIFGGTVTNCVATSCYSDMVIYGGSFAGGIFGKSATNCTASKCYTTGQIGNDPLTGGHGGIFGGSANNCTASTCFYTGQLGGQDGGIFGSNSTGCNANACYAEGLMGGEYAGGIFGYNTTSGTATNCWINCGNTYVGVANSGPIFNFVDGSTNTATNCWTYYDAINHNYLNGAPSSLVGAPTTSPGLGTVWASNANVFTQLSYGTPSSFYSGSPFVFPNYWLGTTSTDWADASNWSRGFVPDPVAQTNYVVIPTTANQPVIGSSTAAVAYTIVIQSGAVLNIAAGGTLTINNGSSVFNTGSVGSADATVITDGGVITVNPGAAITGNYAGISGGTATLQQNIVGQRGWRIFANPFITAQTLATVATNNNITIHTNGSANVASIADDRIFSNTTNLWTDGGTSIAANTAYGLFIRGLASEVTGLTYTGSAPSAFTYNVSGTLNGNSLNIPSPLAGNFMVIGNPYAAPIKSQALTSQLASSNYYTYQISVTGTPKVMSGSWVASGSTSDATHTIPTLGVIAYLPATTLPFSITPNDINLSGTLQTGIFGIQNSTEQIELLVEQNGNYQDKFFLRSDVSSSVNGTDKKDLQKFYNDVVNVYTIAPDHKKLAIDARNYLDTIPLGIQAPVGDYNFKVANNTLPAGTVIYLKDKFLNTQTEIKEGDSYNFTITTDTASKGDYRFELTTVAVKTNTSPIDLTTGNFNAEILGNVTGSNTVSVKITGSKAPVSIRVTDLAGRKLSNIQTGNGTQTVPLGNISSGILILQFSDGKSTITKKAIKF